MSESTLRHHSIEGYPLKGERLTLLCYRLLSGFLASSRMAKLTTEDLRDPIFNLREEYEISEAVHLLIEIAIYCRTAQDKHLKALPINMDWMVSPVGSLVANIDARKKEPLVFREACHKLIHAEDITWEVMKEKEVFKRYLKPFVYLYGTKRENKRVNKWRAKLDIIMFVREAYQLLQLE